MKPRGLCTKRMCDWMQLCSSTWKRAKSWRRYVNFIIHHFQLLCICTQGVKAMVIMGKLNAIHHGPVGTPKLAGHPNPMGLCLLLWIIVCRLLSLLPNVAPPTPSVGKYCAVLHWLSVWQVRSCGLWRACHGYHHLWRWLYCWTTALHLTTLSFVRNFQYFLLASW